MIIQEPVQAAIWHCLNHYAYSDATFLAERLFAETGNDECLFLVATCYYRSGNINQAYHILQGGGLHTAQTKFLFAKCAVDLRKDSEAESVLIGSNIDPRQELNIDDLTSDFGDKTAFALKLLSGIFDRTERKKKAIDAERKALKLNPFLWKSYESLCNRGELIPPSDVFDLDILETFEYCHGNNPLVNLINSETKTEFVEDCHEAVHCKPPQTPNICLNPGLTTQQQTPITAPQQQVPSLTVNETPVNFCTPKQNIMETPLLHCNSISTPFTGGFSTGSQISGISSLNITSDSDISRCPGLMPPPLRPKQRRYRSFGSASANLSASTSPSFGILCQGPLPSVVAAKVLEFSSPQLMILSPVPAPVRQLKSLTSTPVPPPTRASTPSAPVLAEEPRPLKRIAMAAKPENQKLSVLGQSPGNVITPSQNTLPTRRSSRLFGSTQSVKENSKALGKNRISAKSPSRKSKPRMLRNDRQLSESENNEKNKSVSENKLAKEKILDSDSKPEKLHTGIKLPQSHSINMSIDCVKIQKSNAVGLMTLLRQIGHAFLELSRYNCREAISLLEGLPEHHAKSAWCQTYLGKCYFELNEYRNAQNFFRIVRRIDPYRLDMMEYYSTTLWHLQDDVELSALSQELTRISKLSPVSWCAAGNCFSHQKEHENAIRFFQRAVQVDPRFAYAYTLLGHEYVLVEELEKALSCFRTAVRLDNRHYNAWYGIGITYFKQERFQLAEIYFRKALAINPFSPILMCHIAVVQHSLQKSDKAIATLNTAIELAPKNPLCKFELASILHSTEKYQEALLELNQLKDIVPKESPVYFLLGKVHNKLGNTHLAMMHFSWAMDLDPKGANSQIKDALDPALNRAGHESNEEDDLSLNREDNMTGTSGEVSGLIGEDAVFGENNFSGNIEMSGAVGSLLNESDDSL